MTFLRSIYRKVRAVFIAAAAAGLAGLASWAAGYDWSAVDPRWGAAAGMAVSGVIAYLVREVRAAEDVPTPDPVEDAGSLDGVDVPPAAEVA